MAKPSEAAQLPVGIPPRQWTQTEVRMAISTLYSLWERGIGPHHVQVGGKRLILESGSQYLRRLADQQTKQAA